VFGGAPGGGGGLHEWSALAEAAEKEGDFLSASRLYGIAKFPVLGNAAHARAYDDQIRAYLMASAGFEVPFERHLVEVAFRGGRPQVATHLFLPEGLPGDAPVLLALSGVDTWKVELHRFAVTAARALGARVATVDMPGTGESRVANGPDGERYLEGVLDWLRRCFPGARRFGAYGFSFGGHWTTKLALLGRVDAAVAVGAPIDASFGAQELAGLRFGMDGIFGNSLRLDAAPSAAELAAAMAPFSLRAQGLLEEWGSDPVPLLTVNGTDDPHVPQVDTTVFQSRPNTVARLVPNTTHVAAEQLAEVIPWSLQWLADQLS
jgi:esterase FrsA